MKRLKVLLWWSVSTVTVLLCHSGVAEGAARFMHYVPRDPYDSQHEDDYGDDAPRHDADIKLPGRHYPKLPYTLPDPPFLPSYTQTATKGTTDHHYHHSVSPDHHDYDYHQQPRSDDHDGYHDRRAPPYGNPDHTPSGYDRHDQEEQRKEIDDGGYGDDDNDKPKPDDDDYEYDDYDQFHDPDDDRDHRKGTRHLSSPQSDTAGTHQSPPGPTEPAKDDDSPRFDRTQPRSVTVQAGKPAMLVCRVLNIGDKSVSWMRQRDLHILTVGKYKYSTDGRVSVDHVNEEWRLRIKGAQEEDSGMYECQLSTKPILSFIVSLEVVASPAADLPPNAAYPHLRDQERARPPTSHQDGHITVPSAVIVNGPAIHVHRGSLINLTCVVEHTPERPLFVVWYHYNKVIDYDDAGGQVVLSHPGSSTVSQLLVRAARPSDSGKYTCRPSSGEDASVILHVLDGENPAAMQTNSGRLATAPGLSTMLPALFLLLMLLAPC